MMAELKIRTPEGIEFSLQLAGPVSRCMAYIIDLTCVVALVGIIRTLVMLVALISEDVSFAMLVLIQFISQIAYGIACEWFMRGQTLGKRLFKLRVVDEQGLRLEFPQIVIRNLMRFVDAVPFFYAVGGMACFLSKRCQRLGDLAANTVVVHNRPVAEPDLDQLALGKFNSLRAHGHLAARLRQRVSPREAGLALDALLRRDAFDPDARVGLFQELAVHFKSLVAFPPEDVETLTDEQYLRNVVDILFRTRK
jgi:uncharacterized RDD family membrane protein YckC